MIYFLQSPDGGPVKLGHDKGVARTQAADHETGLVRFSLREIRPSPENLRLYRPIRRDDLDIVALAESIETHGLKEPLVVTMDGYIISGHRRYAACCRLGLEAVPCRVEPIPARPARPAQSSKSCTNDTQ